MNSRVKLPSTMSVTPPDSTYLRCMKPWTRSTSLSSNYALVSNIVTSDNFDQGAWLATGTIVFSVTRNLGMYAAVLSWIM